MTYNQAKEELISDSVMNSMPKSDGGRVFTIGREKIRYETAQKLIKEIGLTSRRIGNSLIEYRKM